jgi:hypothetical protein
MKLSEQLKQDHESGDFGRALDGYAERAEALEKAVAYYAEAISLPTPKEIADQLLNTAFLTEDQANTIAADLYQPLTEELRRIKKVLATVISRQVKEFGEHGVTTLLKELGS